MQTRCGEGERASRGAKEKSDGDGEHGDQPAARIRKVAHCGLAVAAVIKAPPRHDQFGRRDTKLVILPVITLVCGMSFIRSRTKTLCAPIAIAANTPATMPCQSRASRTSGPNTRMAAKTASKNVSSASIHGSAARLACGNAECGGRGRGDHKRGDGNELAGNAVVAGDEFGAGGDCAVPICKALGPRLRGTPSRAARWGPLHGDERAIVRRKRSDVLPRGAA